METGNMMEKLNAIPEEAIEMINDTVSFYPDSKLASCFPMAFYHCIEAEGKTYRMSITIELKEMKS